MIRYIHTNESARPVAPTEPLYQDSVFSSDKPGRKEGSRKLIYRRQHWKSSTQVNQETRS